MWKDNVFIALGSNLGSSVDTFDQALAHIMEFSRDVVCSKIYITKPYGYSEQNDFYNAALRISTELELFELLKQLQRIESKLGKTFLFENGPRSIDLDIIFYGDEIIESNDLIVPHPSSHERDFVLLPLADIDPKFVHPKSGKTIASMIQQLDTHYSTDKIIDWKF